LIRQSFYREKQKSVIDRIEKQIKNKSSDFSTVSGVDDFAADSRLCLTGIHLPEKPLIDKIFELFIDPLRTIYPDAYYYSRESLHMTVKNIKVIAHPPSFTRQDIEKAKSVFSRVIPKHKRFKVYFYRLLLFPGNISLIGTTDPELDRIHLDLDRQLEKSGVPDDKKYTNRKYFFSNMTLARFKNPLTPQFLEAVEHMSSMVDLSPYLVDSVTLVVSNAVLLKKEIVGTWFLKS